jgi:formylglycine-generating enzyme required for sulfatase activity
MIFDPNTTSYPFIQKKKYGSTAGSGTIFQETQNGSSSVNTQANVKLHELLRDERPFYRRHSSRNQRAASFRTWGFVACVLSAAVASYFFGISRQPWASRVPMSATTQIDAITPNASVLSISIPKLELITLPGGGFLMGDSKDGMKDAKPFHAELDAFMISKHEITLELWECIRLWRRDHGYEDLPVGSGKKNNHPVCGISWTDSVKWCNALSESQGFTPCYYSDATWQKVLRTGIADVGNKHVNWQADGYRLPTEAEWEFAARGGLDGERFPWGDQITHELANYHGSKSLEYDKSLRDGPAAAWLSSPPLTAPVGSFPANNFGLHDMAGNLAEWCWDFYADRQAISTPTLANPHGPDQGETCIVRGGSWRHTAADARCASRFSMPGTMTAPHVGLRVARND